MLYILRNRTMKRLIFVICLFISIESSFAQNKGITINSTNISLSEIFHTIENQTGYSIAYEQSELDLNKRFNLFVNNKPLQEVLDVCLKGTKCTYKLNGYHIIIRSGNSNFSLDQKNADDHTDHSREVSANSLKKHIYEGTIIDSLSRIPLEYATVTLLDKQGKQLSIGVSNESGKFRLKASSIAKSVRISFTGYETKIVDAGKSDFGTIYIVHDEQLLSEMTIMGLTTQHLVDRNSYLITDNMREKASNAQELLDQIHGVRFDKLSNSIKVGNESSVLLLVDGVQQNNLYIKNLPPSRIHRVEVVTEPTGRYLSEGYTAIINFILKEDYEGYDINIRNFTMAGLAHSNSEDWLMNNQPGIGLTFTKKKINLFANYTHARIRMNMPVWKESILPDYMEMYPVKEDVENANNHYRYGANYVGGGINYLLDPKHSISFQGDYSYQNTQEESQLNYNVLYPKTNVWGKENTLRIDGNRDKDYVATVFYKGEIGQRLKIYSDFTYNYYSNDVDNLYQDNDNINAGNAYKESKNYTKFNIEGEYTFSPKLSLNLGYINVWRKYISRSDYGVDIINLYYNEWRNQTFGYLNYNANDKLAIKAGLNIEYIRTYSETKNNAWGILPYFQLNYKANRNMNVNLSYLTNIDYPTLYQLSPLTTYINSFTRQSGNPELRSAIRHTVSAKLTLWDRLTVRPMFRFAPKYISEVYTSNMWTDGVFSSFDNINVKQYAIQVIYDQPLGDYFKLRNTLTYYDNKVRKKDTKNSYNGFMFDSEIEYFNPKWNLGLQVGYYRDIDKKAMLQGYQMTDLDSWLITVNKQFWKKRASLMISYFPPITWGIRDNLRKEIETSFYSEKYVQNLKPYRNMLMVRFNLRFNSGHIKKDNKQSSTEREERAKRAVTF